MQTKSFAMLAAAAAPLLAASFASAATGYMQLAPFSSLTTTGSTNYVSSTIDGTTAYTVVGDTTLKEFTKTTGLGGTLSTTQLDSSGAINTATGGTSNPIGVLRSSNATTLQLPDSTFDSVYRINKTSGAISTYVDKATLQGTAAAFNIFGSSIYSTGEAVIYDNTSAAPRYRATSAGTAYDVVTAAALVTAAGSYTYGGFTVGATDNQLILQDNNSTAASRRVLSYNSTTGNVTTLLTAADITGVTGGATAAFTNTTLYYSTAEGLVYLYDNTTHDILTFNPAAATPASTLQVVLTGAQLSAGPEGANFVTYFTTYNDTTAWMSISPTGRGLYAVPEPASLGLLAVGGLTLLRRRR